MTEPTELLPCPFCGAAAHFEMDEGRWEWVECESCGMQGNRSASLMEDCKPKLAEEWNRRTPQPTQAQAGAVPLTDEQIKEVMDLVSDWGVQSHLRGEAELDAHNPEATEDEITYAKECAEKERAAWNAIKDKLQAHGIKGGQHG